MPRLIGCTNHNVSASSFGNVRQFGGNFGRRIRHASIQDSQSVDDLYVRHPPSFGLFPLELAGNFNIADCACWRDDC